MNRTAAKRVMVRADGVAVHLGGVVVLEGIDLEVGAGEQVALTGRSGSGKTTLLLTLAGICTPRRGSVTWPDLDQPPPGPGIGVVFQAPSLVPELSALENVQLPMRLRGLSRVDAADRAAEALAAVALTDTADALPAQMSGGQCQRTAIARVLAGRHQLVVADEPTGALDRANARHMLDVLCGAVHDVGGALVVATHDDEFAAALPRRLRLDDGRWSDPAQAVA